MAVLPVRVFPDSILKLPCHAVDGVTPAIRRLIQDLIQTMRHHPRCVGLAAPQVGARWAVAVLETSRHPKGAPSSGLTVLLNPQIVDGEGAVLQREGCLSVPDLTGNVRRAGRVRVRAQDADGQPWTMWFEGFEAIAVQHEVDHLQGRLFLDRVSNAKTDVFQRKTYWRPDEGTTGRSAQ